MPSQARMLEVELVLAQYATAKTKAARLPLGPVGLPRYMYNP